MKSETVVIEPKIMLEKSYQFPGQPRFADNDPIIFSDESNFVLGDRLINVLIEIEKSSSEVILKLNQSDFTHKDRVSDSIEKCQELLLNRSAEIKNNFILDHNVINLRNLLSGSQNESNFQDLALTQLFEILGNDVLNTFIKIVEDPLLINGFGLYFLSIFYLKIWKKVVLRKNLSIRDLSNIFLGSLKNARIRLSQLILNYPPIFFYLVKGFQLFYTTKNFFINRYIYNKRLNLFFFRDLSFIGIISLGINKMVKFFNTKE